MVPGARTSGWSPPCSSWSSCTVNSTSVSDTAPELEMELRILAGRDALALDPRLHATDLAHVVVGNGSPYTNGSIIAMKPRRRRRRRRPAAARRSAWSSHVQPVLLVVLRGSRRATGRAGPGCPPVAGAASIAERLAFGGRGTDLAQELASRRARLVEVDGAVAVVHEQHVDVGGVRELVPTESAHADDRERHRGRSDARAASSARVGEPVELAPGALDRAQPSTSRAAMRRSSRRLKRRSPARRCPGRRATQGLERVADELLGCRSRAEHVVVAEQLDELGLAEQSVADDAARTEDAADALRGARHVAERRRERRGAGGPSASRRSCSSPRSGSGDSDSQSRITGRSCCITREPRVRPCGELAERGARVRRVGEAERREPFFGGLGRQGPVPASVSRSGAKKRRSWIERTAA